MNLSTFKTNNPAAITLLFVFSLIVISLFKIDYSYFFHNAYTVIELISLSTSFVAAIYFSLETLVDNNDNINSMESFIREIDFKQLGVATFLWGSFFFVLTLISNAILEMAYDFLVFLIS